MGSERLLRRLSEPGPHDVARGAHGSSASHAFHRLREQAKYATHLPQLPRQHSLVPRQLQLSQYGCAPAKGYKRYTDHSGTSVNGLCVIYADDGIAHGFKAAWLTAVHLGQVPTILDKEGGVCS